MSWPLALFALAIVLIVAGIAVICRAEQEKARIDAAGDVDADTTGLTVLFFIGSMAVVVAAILLFVLSLHHLTGA